MRATTAARGLFCLFALFAAAVRADEPPRKADPQPVAEPAQSDEQAAKAKDAVLDAGNSAEAKTDGQEDLDRAMEAKLTAHNLRELNAVIALCESALDKGLSETSQKFAKQLLASSLLERGSSICDLIFARGNPPARWAEMRQIGIADLERALQFDPKMVDAYLLIARLQSLPGGDQKRALAAITEVVQLCADDAQKQAEALMLRSTLQEAEADGLEDLNRAVKLAPKDSKPLRARGALKFAMHNVEGAIADFDAALVLTPDDAGTHEAKALAYASQKQWDEARKSFDQAAKLAPDATEVFLQRGRVNALSGNIDGAIADFSEVLRLDPDNVAALLLRAEVLIPDHLEESLADLNRAIDLRPGLVPALRQRAALLAHSKKFTAAIGDLELARKLEADDDSTALQLAAVNAMAGKTDAAIGIYEELLVADPKNVSAYRGRADLYLNQGKQREAIADYEKALGVKEDDTGVLNNLAWVLATSPDESLRNGKRAIDLARQACEETEYKQAHILSTLAAGYAEIGDFTTAVEWSQKALDLSDEDLKPALTKELECYKSSQPWRELQTAASDSAKPAESTRR